MGAYDVINRYRLSRTFAPTSFITHALTCIKEPGSPGLVALGRGSHSEGRGFESQHRILDGHFFTYICCKNCNVCLKRPKINEKEAGVGPFLKTF